MIHTKSNFTLLLPSRRLFSFRIFYSVDTKLSSGLLTQNEASRYLRITEAGITLSLQSLVRHVMFKQQASSALLDLLTLLGRRNQFHPTSESKEFRNAIVLGISLLRLQKKIYSEADICLPA